MGYLASTFMARYYHRAYLNDGQELQRITMRLDREKKSGEIDKQYLDESYNANQMQIQQAYSEQLNFINTQLQEAYSNNDQAAISRLTAKRDQISREEKQKLSQLEMLKNQAANQYQLSKNPLEASLQRKQQYWTEQQEFDKGAWESAKQQAQTARQSIFKMD